MTTPALTFVQPHPGGRILLMLGQHQIGAIFPPAGYPKVGIGPWHWMFWLGTAGTGNLTNKAKTEQAAKNAILAEARDWLRKAGIEEDARQVRTPDVPPARTPPRVPGVTAQPEDSASCNGGEG